ncbi:hypothetical protein KUCAC02_003379 [Chaenocephalus aceratus]|uniref:Uncharacterized protein n=1 Tax=Chaenocephalus aceratus TaxID=36190 RepID=A0ACB9WM61_CHAAC|nr:hypothetical protein KUCAC02_003379 [Chaenocephalus aceratus]
MMWTTTVLLLLVPHLLSSTETGNSANFNESDIVDEDFSDAPVKGQKIAGGVKGRDTCSIPCDITVKLLRDEKHSICGEKIIIFLCLQQTLLAFGRSTRKLIRDVMEEQQGSGHPQQSGHRADDQSADAQL